MASLKRLFLHQLLMAPVLFGLIFFQAMACCSGPDERLMTMTRAFWWGGTFVSVLSVLFETPKRVEPSRVASAAERDAPATNE